jgi:hypothetical protein
MTNEIWNAVVLAIRSLNNPPSWLQKIASLGHAEISCLPKLDNTAEGHIAAPSISEVTVKEDYLEFLREQIRLEPRGPEWTAVLRTRLNALQPFVGKQVLMASFYEKPQSSALYINPEGGQVILAEID